DLDLSVLEPDEADPNDAGVVVHRESHDVDLRRRVQGPTDLVDRLPSGYRGEGLGEGALGVRAAEFQCVRESLVEEPVPRESVGGRVVQPDDRVARKAAIVLTIEGEQFR